MNKNAGKEKMEIIKATTSHLEELHQFARENFMLTYAHLNTEENMRDYLQESFSKEAFEREFDHPESEFHIIIENSEIVGYFKINMNSAQTEDTYPNSLEIERIYVTSRLKGQGVGRQMIKRSKQIALEKNLDFIWLGVWEQNPKAIAFYEKMGFQPIDKHVFQLGKDAQTDLIMKLTI